MKLLLFFGILLLILSPICDAGRKSKLKKLKKERHSEKKQIVNTSDRNSTREDSITERKGRSSINEKHQQVTVNNFRWNDPPVISIEEKNVLAKELCNLIEIDENNLPVLKSKPVDFLKELIVRRMGPQFYEILVEEVQYAVFVDAAFRIFLADRGNLRSIDYLHQALQREGSPGAKYMLIGEPYKSFPERSVWIQVWLQMIGDHDEPPKLQSIDQSIQEWKKMNITDPKEIKKTHPLNGGVIGRIAELSNFDAFMKSMKVILRIAREENFELDFDNRGIFDGPPLHRAAQFGRYKNLAFLLSLREKGKINIDLNSVSDVNGLTAVTASAVFGHYDSLKQLINAGAEVPSVTLSCAIDESINFRERVENEWKTGTAKVDKDYVDMVQNAFPGFFEQKMILIVQEIFRKWKSDGVNIAEELKSLKEFKDGHETSENLTLLRIVTNTKNPELLSLLVDNGAHVSLKSLNAARRLTGQKRTDVLLALWEGITPERKKDAGVQKFGVQYMSKLFSPGNFLKSYPFDISVQNESLAFSWPIEYHDKEIIFNTPIAINYFEASSTSPRKLVLKKDDINVAQDIGEGSFTISFLLPKGTEVVKVCFKKNSIVDENFVANVEICQEHASVIRERQREEQERQREQLEKAQQEKKEKRQREREAQTLSQKEHVAEPAFPPPPHSAYESKEMKKLPQEILLSPQACVEEILKIITSQKLSKPLTTQRQYDFYHSYAVPLTENEFFKNPFHLDLKKAKFLKSDGTPGTRINTKTMTWPSVDESFNVTHVSEFSSQWYRERFQRRSAKWMANVMPKYWNVFSLDGPYDKQSRLVVIRVATVDGSLIFLPVKYFDLRTPDGHSIYVDYLWILKYQLALALPEIQRSQCHNYF